MARHSVDVLIKARDQASKKFGIVAASSRIMAASLHKSAALARMSFAGVFSGISTAAGLAFKGIISIAKRTLLNVRKIVRWTALAIAGAFTYSAYAAMKQEAAEIELASALKMTGKYSDALMEKLKKQAAEIQAVTTHGDEYVLTLMRMALTLGWTEDKAADAAKAAIALYEGFGGGRGKPEIFLRYYTDAVRGTAKSLDTYIGELRKAKTEEERQIILQKNVAKGWDVAKSKADSATGSLKQMKNTLGDAAEAFQRPFLVAYVRASKAIKKWAEDNETNIRRWGETTYSYVALVKDVFVSYIEYMKKDWREGFKKSLDAALIIFKGFGRSLLIMAEKLWQDFENRMLVAGKRALAKWLDYQKFHKEGLRKARELFGPGKGPFGMLTTEEAREYAEKYAREKVLASMKAGVYEVAFPTLPGKTWEEAWQDVVTIMKNSAKEAAGVMPEFAADIEDAFKKHKKRLEEIATTPFKPAMGEKPEREKPAPAWKEPLVSRRQLPAEEARFLTFAPGRKFDQVEVNTRKTVVSIKELISLTKKHIEIAESLQTLYGQRSRAAVQISNFA